MTFSFLHTASPLRLLGMALALCCLSLSMLACGDGDIVQKNYVCDKDEDCKASQVCQGGECVAADNDKDGFARNKDCNDNNRLVYPGAPERCKNQIDDNCDGQVDEDPCLCKDGDVRACGLKIGECRQGQQTCSNAKWSDCKGSVEPVAEICDGKDNDCDGSVDEELANCCRPGDKRRCGSNVGECKSGWQRCDAGKWLTCEGDKRPNQEVCDNKDNDCDGIVDNLAGFKAPLQKPCYTGAPPTRNVGACREGLSFCRLGQWSKCEKEVLPSKETCDGKDNDCNGKTDESFPDVGKDCIIKNLKGECAKSVYTCDKGAKKCEQTNKPVAELCNNKDDDCDGVVDNKKGDTTPMTRACYDGPKTPVASEPAKMAFRSVSEGSGVPAKIRQSPSPKSVMAKTTIVTAPSTKTSKISTKPALSASANANAPESTSVAMTNSASPAMLLVSLQPKAILVTAKTTIATAK